jgi:hypothetical protein
VGGAARLVFHLIPFPYRPGYSHALAREPLLRLGRRSSTCTASPSMPLTPVSERNDRRPAQKAETDSVARSERDSARSTAA